MRFLAAGLLLLLGLGLSVPEAHAQTGIFSIFRMPQQQDTAPEAEAEDDAALAVPPLNALPAPHLPLPPARMTVVPNPAAPAPRPGPPPLVAVPPPPVAAPPAAPSTPPVASLPSTGSPAPDLPVPPRRSDAPEPEVAEAPAAEATPPAPPPIDHDSFAESPRMMASLPFPGFRPMRQPPLQQQETTTEELEKEEQRTPEPMQVEKQTDYVDIACLKPELLTLVRKAGDRFGATPVITSGQRYRGRLGSYHRRCMAADFFVPGVARSDLARFLRSLPDAGGVGTYCHTKSVHIDIGEPRNWSQCGFRFRFSQRG